MSHGPVRRAMRAWLCLLFLPLAGCVNIDVGDLPATDDTPVLLPEPFNLTFYVTPDELVTAPPVGSTFPLSWSTSQWLAGLPPPTFRGTGPEDRHWLVLNGTMYFEYHVAQATSSAGTRPELTSWFGHEDNVVHHVFSDGPDTVQAGQRLSTIESLRIPLGGYVIPEGSDPMLQLGSYYGDGPMADAIEVVTGTQGTRFELTIQEIVDAPIDEGAPYRDRINLRGNRCVFDGNLDGQAEHQWTVPVTDDTARLRVEFDGNLLGDIDVAILGPDGQDVGGSHGPGGRESADAWWPNLQAAGPGDYTVHLYACTPQSQSVDVTITTWTWDPSDV